MRRSGVAVLIAALVATPLSVVPASAQDPPRDTVATAEANRTVTLITGDQVMVAGDRVAGVRMAEHRRHVRYVHYRLRDHDHVLPVDAAPLVANGVLDARLFDVTTLLQQGFDDASEPALPTIMRADAAAVPGVASTTRALTRLGLTAVSTPKAQAANAWRVLLPAIQSGTASKVWLNGRVRPSLDQSVPQVGAPAAWQAGLRGAGVKVAVLDTGYDATHPDLRSTVDAEADFTTDGNPRLDPVGHGTHVASTIAGRGTASGGRYTGVAPDARLLVGKVLSAGGGLEDWVLAGMEWAVAQGAKVVNMSLGGGPTDGTDPLSQAVNQLSESSGALFVIAAGNSGAYGTVDTPGTADRALTVGSVTKGDQLSFFSSRGPRVGDYGLKPEISAPGSDIVAARAAGRLAGQAVDEHHARLSGTSMATPHVAGAAAILAGQHPDWTGEQIKNALVGSAKRLPNIDTYGQGAGRLDVARAVGQRVRADGMLGFGQVWFEPGAPRVSRKVSYTNDGDRPLRLRLTVDARAKDGRPAPAGLFTVDNEWLTVPARSSASVTVLAPASEQNLGEVSGVLTATGHDTVLNTPLTAHLTGRKHSLTIRTLPRAGQALYASLVIVQNEETGWSEGLVTLDGVVRFEVGGGRYRAIGLVLHASTGEPTMFARPAALDTEVVVDANEGKRVRASVDDIEAEPARGGGNAIQSDVAGRTEFMIVSGMVTDRYPLYTIGSPRMTGLRFNHFGYWWHPFARAEIPGPGGFVFDSPYTPWPLGFEGRLTARLVDVGEADTASIEKAGDLTGAIALIGPADWSQPFYPPGEQLRSGIELIKRKGGRAIASFFNPTIDDPAEVPPPLPTVLLFNPIDVQQAQNLVRQRPVELSMIVRPNSPVNYFLADGVDGSVPAGHEFRFQRANLGRVERDLVDTMPADQYRYQNGFWQRDNLIARADVETRWPNRRTDYVSSGTAHWMTATTGFTDDGEFGLSDTIPMTLRAGEVRPNRMLGAPFGPELTTPPVSNQDGKPVPWAYREGNRLNLSIPMFADANPDNRGWPDSATTGTTVLYKHGKEIARGDRPALGVFDLPTGPGRFTLVADASRPTDTLVPALGSKSKAEWSFRVGNGTDRRDALPLLDVRFDLPLDDHNRAAVGALNGNVTVVHQPGARSSRIRSLDVAVSFDDGRTWQRVGQRKDGDRWQVTIPNGGAAGGYVSLRATASDVDGNAVTETMIRGYALR